MANWTVFANQAGQIPLVDLDQNFNLVNGVNVLSYGADPTGTADSTTAIQAALTAAGSSAPVQTVYLPPGQYKTTTTLNIPLGVTLTGPATAWNNITKTSGAILFPNHNLATLSLIGDGSNSNSAGGGICNLFIQCNHASYPSTSGIYITGAQQVIVKNIVVSQAGGTAFTFGDYASGAGLMTTYITADNCYSNTTYGVAFKIYGKWHRLNELICDGTGNGTASFQLAGCQFSSFKDTHIEGNTTGCMTLTNSTGNNVFMGKSYFNSSGSYCVQMDNTSGTYINTFRDCAFIGAVGTTYGIQLAGSNNVVNTVETCTFNSCLYGVYDIGATTTVRDNLFYGCNLPIYSNSSDSKYLANRMQATTGSYSIQHAGGTTGLWEGNTLDKPINPAITGVAGNFSGIIVKNNAGYVTKNSGTTGSITAYTNIAHGLAGAPSSSGCNIQVSTFSSGITSYPQLTAITATNFQLYWTGTASVQWNWTANLPCDP